jgi:hypothetical protein
LHAHLTSFFRLLGLFSGDFKFQVFFYPDASVEPFTSNFGL